MCPINNFFLQQKTKYNLTIVKFYYLFLTFIAPRPC